MENVVEVDAHKDDDVVEVGAKKFDGPWTSKNEAIFIKLMDLEVPGRPKDTSTFKKDAWNRIIVQLRAKTGYNYNYEQLRNKYNIFRTTYNAFKKLLNETTGVGWDPKRQTITLADDVWKNLCKVNKHARQFKKKGCPHYDKLGRIYGKTSATGEHTHVSTQLPSNSEEEKDPTFDPTNEVDTSNGNENDKGPSNRSRSRSITPTCSRRWKKDDVMVGLTSALNVLVETSKKKNEYLEYKMSGALVATSSYGDSEVTNHKDDMVNECVAALNALEDIDAHGYSKAITKFSEGMIWRKLFMAMSDHRKRDWITCL